MDEENENFLFLNMGKTFSVTASENERLETTYFYTRKKKQARENLFENSFFLHLLIHRLSSSSQLCVYLYIFCRFHFSLMKNFLVVVFQCEGERHLIKIKFSYDLICHKVSSSYAKSPIFFIFSFHEGKFKFI